uniref:Osteoclast-stimulating factor 1 n=1 Tax=Angiostrongylus cantonensis TaxID=6313 RepID=A0A0K0D044_ANGCA
MMTAAPPRPAPKPGRVRVYRALYSYEARTDQEMSFAEGDILYVSDRGPNDDWLPATCGGKKGLVPMNYVVSENVEELSNPLHEAARRGNLLFLIECINNQVSVNSLDKSGSTALYWACHGGHASVVKYLLELPGITTSSQVLLFNTFHIYIILWSSVKVVLLVRLVVHHEMSDFTKQRSHLLTNFSKSSFLSSLALHYNVK